MHTKLRKVQSRVYSKADPAETSSLLWKAADSVTTRKRVKQNSFVLKAYFDIGLFGACECQVHGCENTKLLLKVILSLPFRVKECLKKKKKPWLFFRHSRFAAYFLRTNI